MSLSRSDIDSCHRRQTGPRRLRSPFPSRMQLPQFSRVCNAPAGTLILSNFVHCAPRHSVIKRRGSPFDDLPACHSRQSCSSLQPGLVLHFWQTLSTLGVLRIVRRPITQLPILLVSASTARLCNSVLAR
ncbi:hypothetical protein EXIGLDRAFT_151784 [Exidia glandulosa HHB12029]|uniref:Uncharacterized protein n=1 Tax=Exidia glandulosa HHB12029 TaxID=1314781 RepID=A0A165QDE7_EXIGL|nr:hypothetical protein EXIGLDRAFT_151784 [Exidia glandulosa HHB12029]